MGMIKRPPPLGVLQVMFLQPKAISKRQVSIAHIALFPVFTIHNIIQASHKACAATGAVTFLPFSGII